MNRQAEQRDYSFIYNLYMHRATNPWLLYEWMSEGEFLPIFEELVNRHHLFVYSEDGLDMGMFKLQPMKHRNSHIVYLGGVAVDPGVQGRGVGSRMMKEIVAKAGQMGFRRIELTVATNNKAAIRLYTHAGFAVEGILKNYSYLSSEHKYLDEQVMALLLA
jgi:putative acetyltransferase